MTDRSEDSVEEELRELEAELADDAADGSAADAAGAADDVATADELAGGDDASLDGDAPASDDAAGSVGLDRDPSEQYSDLLGDVPDASAGDQASAEAGSSADSTAAADASDADSGGLLSRLFGRDSEPATEGSSAGERQGATATSTPDADVPDTDELLDDVDSLTGSDAGLDADPAAGAEREPAVEESPATGQASASGSRLSGLRGYFSPRAFLAAAVAMAVLGGIGTNFVPLVGGPFGLWLGAFLVGLGSGDGRYLECAVAGALVGALGVLAGGVSVAIAVDATRRLLAIGGAVGLVVALVGQYFGNDLRAGLAEAGSDWEPEP